MKTWVYIIGFIIIIIGPSLLVYKITNDYVPTTAMATAISTATLAIVTFLNLRHLRETENREIKEKIYSVIHRQLEAFLQPASHTVRFDSNGRDLSISWDWNAIKNQEFHLAYRIPKDLFDRLKEFTEVLSRYKDSFTQCVKEILKEMSSRVQNYWATGSKDVFYVEIKIRGKGGQFSFDVFECLFLEKDIRKTLLGFRLKNEAEAEIKCNFLNGARESLYIEPIENKVIEFFEELFQHIKEKSENYKNLVSSRESAKDLAHQILKSISPS